MKEPFLRFSKCFFTAGQRAKMSATMISVTKVTIHDYKTSSKCKFSILFSFIWSQKAFCKKYCHVLNCPISTVQEFRAFKI